MQSDVIVVGAGPVGLFLACELRLAGADVVVLEREAEADNVLRSGPLGFRALSGPTIRALHRRDLLASVRANAAWWRDSVPRVASNATASPFQGFVGHFAGMTLDAANLDISDPALAAYGKLGAGSISLAALERLLAERALQLGVQIERGAAVTSLDATEDGVTVHTDTASHQAGWLVGCDGGRSIVRKSCGFTFAGTDPVVTAYMARVELADADTLGGGWIRTERGMYVVGPQPGRLMVVEFCEPPRDRDTVVTREAIEGALQRVSASAVRVTAMHEATWFSDNARQATEYRRGRVLLAGDAAHVHSPFGGQGLNLGMGDAFNLGWKLGLVATGRAPAALLDSYGVERQPLAARALQWCRAQAAIMRTDPLSMALSELIRDLLQTRDVTTEVVKRIGGGWQRYAASPLHPLIGQSAPELLLDENRELDAAFLDGRAVLVDLSGDRRLATLVAPWASYLHIERLEPGSWGDLGALLMRPDGFVAYAADHGTALDPIAGVLSQLFGDRSLPMADVVGVGG